MSISDDVDDDASSLLVMKLMQTGSNVGNNNSSSSSPVLQRIAASTATAAAAVAVAGVSSGSVKTVLTDTAGQHVDNGFVDPSEERGSLHQLSLYVLSFCCMTVTFIFCVFYDVCVYIAGSNNSNCCFS